MKLSFKQYGDKAFFETTDTDAGSCLFVKKADGNLNSKNEFQSLYKKGDLLVCKPGDPTPDQSGAFSVTFCEFIYGFYELLSGTYVALVKDSETYVDIKAGPREFYIKRIKSIQLLPLFQNGRPLSDSKQEEENKYLHLLNSAFSECSLFYSPTSKYDVTNSYQRNYLIKSIDARPMNGSQWSLSDHRFFWNRDVLLDLIRCKADDWIVPVISGMVEFRHDCVADSDCFSMLFISRRSRYNQGCRFTKRGLDEHGNPANFVETEQILIFPDSRIKSFVQIRGSIPLVWSSPVTMKYDPVVRIGESSAAAKNNNNNNNNKYNSKVDGDRLIARNSTNSPEFAGLDTSLAERHIDEVLDIYGDNNKKSALIFVNLIDKKKDQQRLGSAFEHVVKAYKAKQQADNMSSHHTVEYIWFDFHQECKKKGKWKNLAKLVKKVDPQLRTMGFFDLDANGLVKRLQIGVFRVNCMDNLDRTNVVQSLFARRSLLLMLGRKALLDVAPQSISADVIDTPYILDSPWPAFEKVYKSVWANNANAMSLGYAGTGALKVDFTKTGKRTFKGMIDDGINSCVRYYLNNFSDGNRQDSIDLMLGKYQPDRNLASPSPFVRNVRPEQLYLPQVAVHFVISLFILFAVLLLLSPVLNPFHNLFREFHLISKLSEIKSSENHFLAFCGVYGEFRAHWDLTYNTNVMAHVVFALLGTLVVMIYCLVIVLKKGSKIGSRLVNTPCLLPDIPVNK